MTVTQLSTVRRLDVRTDDGETTSRPRATWRVLVPLLAVLVPGVAGVSLLAGAFEPEPFHHVQTLLFALLTAATLVATARWLDRRPIRAYGFDVDRLWWAEFAVGAALGIAINGLVLAVALGFGWARVDEWWAAGDTFGVATGLAVALAGYLLVAAWEETLFRGIALTNAAEGLVARLGSDRLAVGGAVVLTTLLFAVLHLNQVPSVDVLPLMVTILVLTGGLLALAYVTTGSLALPIGLHFTVNFASTSLFGLRGEWGRSLPSVVRLDTAAPDALVPMAGVLAGSWIYVGAVVVGYLALFGWLRVRPAG